MRRKFTIFGEKRHISNLNLNQMEKIQFQTTLLDKVKAANNNAQVDNLSDRTISEIVEMFYPSFTDDEKITDDSWKLPVQMIKTMSGQLRHDTSAGINAFKTKFEEESKTTNQKAIDDAIAAFKAQWEKDHPIVDPNKKPEEKPDVTKLVAEQVAEQMKALTGEGSEFQKLSKQFSDYLAAQALKDKAASEEELRKQVLKHVIAFDDLDEDDAIVENVMLKLDFKGDKTLDDLKNEAKGLYETAFKKYITKHGGAQPFSGGGGGGGGLDPLIKGHIDRVAAEAKDAEDYREGIEFAK